MEIAKEYQNLLYSLFNEKLFRMEGTSLENKEGYMEEYIPKSDFIDSAIEILNELVNSNPHHDGYHEKKLKAISVIKKATN